MVSWFIVCLYKSKGGLGVRNFLLPNKSLLCKWNWHFAEGGFLEASYLWKIWGGGRRMVHPGGEGSVWGWVMESH